MTAPSSPEAPWPVRTVARKVAEWIGRLGEVWVEGQVAQLSRRGNAATAPVQGYDGFSIPSLRGHLRGYTAETVADLLDYERATRARAPYVTLLQNRLEKLSIDRG